MGINYFRMAFRIMKKYKLHSAINIVGLSIGMALSLVMLMYVANEFSYDNYHENSDRIYRVTAEWGKEGSRMNFAGVMPALAPTLNTDVTDIELAARLRWNNEMTLQVGAKKEFKEEDIFNADPEIMKIFQLQLIEGSEENALSEPYSIVLTQSVASKYYGKEDPLGQVIVIDGESYKVTGLLPDLPTNTHLKISALISYSTIISKGEYPEFPWSSWGSDITYILLSGGASLENCKSAVSEIYKKNTIEYLADKMFLHLQPLSDIHWNNTLRADIGPKGNKLYAYLFLFAAILVLVIASFNFMNLSTTKFMDRAKEVGVRKVIGANRFELVKQFLIESMMLSFFAAILGIVIYELLSGVIYSYMNVNYEMHTGQLVTFYLLIIAMLVIVGLFAGLYPAAFLSKFKPAEVINGKSQSISGKFSFRNISLILQFTISVILICSATIIFQQIDYMKNTDLGFNKENVVFAQLPLHQVGVIDKYEVLKNELLRNPNIAQVSGAYTIPGVNSQFQMGVRGEGVEESATITIQAVPVDYDFLELLGVSLLQGRNFSKEFSTDAEGSIIINKTAAEALNLQNPIGENIVVPYNNEPRNMKIIGVVDDFHIKSLHNKIVPTMLLIYPKLYSLVAAKYKPGTENEVINYFKSTWQSVLPAADFNYRFMLDEYNKNYSAEENAGKLVAIFTLLALFISCLGLFGMVSFITSKKVKEIGIRKVLGASVQSIFSGLSKQFMTGVILANLIAWPIAYYLMEKWLHEFAYRVDISIWVFLFSGLLTMLIAVITISVKVVRAAGANPVKSLRYE